MEFKMKMICNSFFELKTYGDSREGGLSDIDILRLGGLLVGGVTFGSFVIAAGGVTSFGGAGTTGGTPGTAAGGITPGIPGTTPGTMPGIIGTAGTTPGCVTTGIPATPATPGTPVADGIMAEGITGTAPATCCIGGMPTIDAGAILACGTIPGNVPGTIPGTIGTAPAIGAIGAAVGTVAAAIATFAIAGAGGTSGFTEVATLFKGSKGLRLPAPVGVNVGVVPIDVKETSNDGGKALGTSMPRNFKFINLHALTAFSFFVEMNERQNFCKAMPTYSLRKFRTLF